MTHNCHADSRCTNTKGSFYCTCNVGYTGDGVTCTGTSEIYSSVFKIYHMHLSSICKNLRYSDLDVIYLNLNLLLSRHTVEPWFNDTPREH